MRIAVIGAGSWGTALAQVLGGKGHDVVMWAREQKVADSITLEHRNCRYLTDAVLSDSISATTSRSDALLEAEAVVLATPSQYVRETMKAFSSHLRSDLPIVICSKGVEAESGLLMIQVVAEEVGHPSRIAVLSGPTHAEEVIRSQPSATVIAGDDSDTVIFFRDLFATEKFRTYASSDPVGVELCGAFKNVIAIAVGISYGMGYGDNTAALLITRGLAEMSRMVVSCGGNALTCMGLGGAGDMVVTCMSRHSRNRRFGQDYVAEGKTLADFEQDTHMVVEGAFACRTLNTLSEKHGVELPLTDAVRQIVWEHAGLKELARALFMRPLTSEFYGIESSQIFSQVESA